MNRARRLASLALGGAAVALLAAASQPRALPADAPAPSSPPAASAPPFESWKRWTGWSETCALRVAPANALPAAPRWESCAALGLPAPACRSMVVDWPHGEASPLAVAPLARATRDGRVRLAFTRLALGARPYKEWIVTDADGPVHAAIAQPQDPNPHCTLVESSVLDDGAAWLVRGDGSAAHTAKADALVTWSFEEAAPRVVFRNHDDAVSSWIAGDRWLVRSIAPARRAEAYAPSGALLATLHDPARDPDGLPLAGNPPVVEPGGVLFEIGDVRARALLAYDGRAVRPLLRWPLDAGRAAGNLGSDGRVLVWTQGSDPLGDGRYRTTRVVTAPFTVDPGALRPRELAVDPNPLIGAAPFVVGCGRAAHSTPDGPAVFDLETGKVTLLPALPSAKWGRPLALGCGELFVTYFAGARAGIARVALR